MELRLIDVRGTNPDYRAVVPRGAFDVEHALAVVEPICAAVAERGEAALREFDGVEPEHLRVPVEELARCADELDADVRAALVESIRRRREVAQTEGTPALVRAEVAPGAVVETKTVPVSRVGLYVPGGLAPWPPASS